MERSFKEEVKSLRLGEGDTFHGEGILAVTKALLQSGVSYISGYPGAPVSHLVDVLTDAEDILDVFARHSGSLRSSSFERFLQQRRYSRRGRASQLPLVHPGGRCGIAHDILYVAIVPRGISRSGPI